LGPWVSLEGGVFCVRFGWGALGEAIMGGREDQTGAMAEKGAMQEAKKDRGAAVTTTAPEKEVTLKELARKMAGFAADREWDQFHSPRNLLLALVMP
jgi:hypothetical protein